MNRQRIEYIDFAKGFAILSIVLFHFCQPYTEGYWAKLIMIGGSAVHLFIILSGFGLSLSSQNIDISTFFKKRFTKIILPYYCVILFIYVINFIYLINNRISFYTFGGHILFYNIWDTSIIGSFGYHFWFIAVIIQLYLLFPILIWIKNKTSLSVFLFISLILAILTWTLRITLNPTDMTLIFTHYLWEFSLGIVFADLYRNYKVEFWNRARNSLLLILSASGILLMALLAIKGGQIGRVVNDIPASIGFLSLSILAFSVCTYKIYIIKKLILYVSTFSYELYLILLFTLFVINKFLESILSLQLNIFISLSIVFPLTLLIAWLIYRTQTIIHKREIRIK